MDRTFAEDVLHHAVAVLGDERDDSEDREDAARVIQAVLLRACPTEADLADLLTALGRALHVHLAVRRVLGEVQRLRPDTVVERAGRGVERLMGQAFRAGDREALSELLLVALEEPQWISWLRDDWGKAAVTWATNTLPRRRYPIALLIGGWLHAFRTVPPWMSEIVEERPDLVTSGALPPATQWQLHTAAPSVAGWHHLSGKRGVPPEIEARSFGDRLAVAVETVERAHGEATDEGKRFALLRWLHELTGTSP